MLTSGTQEAGETLTSMMETLVARTSATRRAKAYMSGLFIKQARSARVVDFSDQSLVLAHIERRGSYDLDAAQRLGDWVLWMLSFFPAHAGKHRELAETLGRLNYLRCYKLVPSWTVYEEFSDMLPVYTRDLCLARKAMHART